MNTQDLAISVVAVLRTQIEDCCTYCHRFFGSLVTWRGRNRYLQEEVDHVLPRAIGGKITVPCCQICNRIKGSLVFESLAEIQDYCLDVLLKDGSMTLSAVRELRVRRAIVAEESTASDLGLWVEEEAPQVPFFEHVYDYERWRRRVEMAEKLSRRPRVPLGEPPSRLSFVSRNIGVLKARAGVQKKFRERLPSCDDCGGSYGLVHLSYGHNVCLPCSRRIWREQMGLPPRKKSGPRKK